MAETESVAAEPVDSFESGGPAPAGTHIGHVHLKVSDLERAVWFYHEVLGFDLLFNMGTAAFLSAGGYHHHIALNTWQSKGGKTAPENTTGLYHFAINYPTRRDLAAAVRRIYDHGWQIDGAQDHTTHEAIYLHDPDLNGIELACDRDSSYWSLMLNPPPDAWRTMNKPIDFDSLMGELGDPEKTGVARYLPALRTFR